MPKLSPLDVLFLALMAAAGIGLAFAVSRNPGLEQSAIPPIIWPIGAALLFDIVTGAMRGGAPPLAMPIRATGVIAAMALYVLLAGRL